MPEIAPSPEVEDIVDLFGNVIARKTTVVVAVCSNWPPDYQEQFWSAYPLKRDKAKAMRALVKVKRRGDVSFAMLISRVVEYAAWLGEQSPQTFRPYPKYPATFLNGECWKNELKLGESNGHAATPSQRARQFAQRAADLERERDGGGGTSTAVTVNGHRV